MKIKVIALLLLTMGVIGCGKPYSDRDKELYLSDMESLVTAYERIDLPDPAYKKIWPMIRDAKANNGGEISKIDAYTIYQHIPKFDAAALDDMAESVRRKYTKTPVDEEYKLVEKYLKVNSNLASAVTAQQAFAASSLLNEGEISQQNRTKQSDVDEAIEAFRKDLSEFKSAIGKARAD